jgi:[acyl-carrier-protein] S-malonyltransferase
MMAESMEDVTWNDPQGPLVANYSGEVLTTGDEIHRALVEQIASPVRFVECVQALAAAGAERFLEVGPGRVLAGLVRQIEPEVDVDAADSPSRLDVLAAVHTERARP